ncbi:MAG: hypothetical protein ACLQUY_01480 [Ktedonobacterales bacterium]
MRQQSLSGGSSPVLADLEMRTRTIYSRAEDWKRFQAVEIRNDWIVAASEDRHGLDGLINAGTRVLDDPKLTLLPALEDTHHQCIRVAACCVPALRVPPHPWKEA